MTTVYTTDDQLIYAGPVEIDPDGPLPPHSTLTAPPATTGSQVAQLDGSGWVVLAARPPVPVVPLAHRQALAWDRIKRERDRRKYLGVKVGAHWFHSDAASRIQQLALVIMGANIPPGLQWKTLTFTPPPVFVTMTQALAQGIFQATATSDAAIFASAEAHRLAMESSAEPQDYDISSGWPPSIEDEANQAGVQFDAKMI